MCERVIHLIFTAEFYRSTTVHSFFVKCVVSFCKYTSIQFKIWSTPTVHVKCHEITLSCI